MPQDKIDRTKTMPWHERELVYYNGFFLHYHCRDGAIADVYIPGGRTEHVVDLEARAKAEGVPFALPERVRGKRGSNYAGRGCD